MPVLGKEEQLNLFTVAFQTVVPGDALTRRCSQVVSSEDELSGSHTRQLCLIEEFHRMVIRTTAPELCGFLPCQVCWRLAEIVLNAKMLQRPANPFL